MNEPIIDRWRDGDERTHCTHCDACGQLFRTGELSLHKQQAHLGGRAEHDAHREKACRWLTLFVAGIQIDQAEVDAWVKVELRLRDVAEHIARPGRRQCTSPKVKTLAGVFGELCGAPATTKAHDGRPMCEACAAYHERQWANRHHPNTLGSILSRALRERDRRRD